MSAFADRLKKRIQELIEARKARQMCWPCEMDSCGLVKEVTPHDKEICICCRNYHVR